MYAALGPLIGLAGAVAAYQFDLQMVQGVDVGEAVAHRALQGRVAGQALLVAGDQLQRFDGALPFSLDGRENFLAQAGIVDQIGVSRSQGQVALGQHHVHI